MLHVNNLFLLIVDIHGDMDEAFGYEILDKMRKLTLVIARMDVFLMWSEINLVSSIFYAEKPAEITNNLKDISTIELLLNKVETNSP